MDKFVTRSRAPVEEQEVELGNLPADPGLRIPISDYHLNLKDKVRRAYLQKGACQPSHNFKKRKIGNLLRRFNPNWFNEYKLWSEYSVEKEAAFCLYCYLFKSDPNDFSSVELMMLGNQLDTYIFDMRSDNEFLILNEIAVLAEKLVQTKKDMVYPLIYLLIKLALILPVSTASVERAFSAMKIVKSRLRNRMGDQLLNGSLVTYIEKAVFDGVLNKSIIQRFQHMKNRRGQL